MLFRRLRGRVFWYISIPCVCVGYFLILYITSTDLNLRSFFIDPIDHQKTVINHLYWKSRNAESISDSVLQENSIFGNLWRPTDQFVGNSSSNYDDRILPQLLWSSTPFQSRKKIIALPDGFYSWNFKVDDFHNTCPNLVEHCEYIDVSKGQQRRKRTLHVDVAIFRFSSSNSKIPGNYTRAVYILESSFHASASLNKTDILASYWRGSDIVTPYGKWVNYDYSTKTKPQERNYAKGKTKMAAMFASNCSPVNGRMSYVQQLQNFVSVHVYGSCGTLECSRDNENSCFELLKRDYKFYLSFENSNCRDYITEKFFRNALLHDVLPVVMGAHRDDYKAVAPLNSYIHIDDFSSPEALANYLTYLNEHDEEYNKYFEWKGTGEFINTKFFCRFCAMIHYSDLVPIPIRQLGMEWNAHQNNDSLHGGPCLPMNQIHWDSI